MPNAIIRSISPKMADCELTHLERHPIDLQLAISQHEIYENTLGQLGYHIIRAEAAPQLPDSVFVEDCVVVVDELAILTHPGAESRRAEVEGLEAVLKPYRKLYFIQPPSIIDGGDVLVIGKQIWIGLSNRSDKSGVEQFRNIVTPYNYSVEGIHVTGCLHLKSAVTQVAEKTVLLNPDWIDANIFKDFKIIKTHPDEPHAANALLLNKTVLFPKAYPLTAKRLMNAGIKIIQLDNSEVIKAEGALTCCSVIFD